MAASDSTARRRQGWRSSQAARPQVAAAARGPLSQHSPHCQGPGSDQRERQTSLRIARLSKRRVRSLAGHRPGDQSKMQKLFPALTEGPLVGTPVGPGGGHGSLFPGHPPCKAGRAATGKRRGPSCQGQRGAGPAGRQRVGGLAWQRNTAPPPAPPPRTQRAFPGNQPGPHQRELTGRAPGMVTPGRAGLPRPADGHSSAPPAPRGQTR